jgi:hypothetical protein
MTMTAHEDRQHFEQLLALDATLALTGRQRKAAALLLAAAGCRPPVPVITDVGDLADSEVGTVICDAGSVVYQRAEITINGLDWEMPGSDWRWRADEIALPVQVLT